MSQITTDQMAELLARAMLPLGKKGRVDRAMLQAFLDDPDRFVERFPTTVNRDPGLMALIQAGVGPTNLRNIHSDITPERFKLTGTGVRDVLLEVQSCRDDENRERVAKRLVADGFVLEGIGELAAFEEQYPEQVEKWHGGVLAINEAHSWKHPNGEVFVYMPIAYVREASRGFDLLPFHSQLRSVFGVLVSRPASSK